MKKRLYLLLSTLTILVVFSGCEDVERVGREIEAAMLTATLILVAMMVGTASFVVSLIFLTSVITNKPKNPTLEGASLLLSILTIFGAIILAVLSKEPGLGIFIVLISLIPIILSAVASYQSSINSKQK